MNRWHNLGMAARESGTPTLPGSIRKFLALVILPWLMISFNPAYAQEQQMSVRISEIQIDANHLAEYKAILKEEAAASVRLEPGVLAIFPMYQRESDTEFRILEIYADRGAYESHLKTPHFQKYKSGTLNMVKSLKLVDMQTVDADTMPAIFKKMKGR